jgi:hypothetical protein
VLRSLALTLTIANQSLQCIELHRRDNLKERFIIALEPFNDALVLNTTRSYQHGPNFFKIPSDFGTVSCLACLGGGPGQNRRVAVWQKRSLVAVWDISRDFLRKCQKTAVNRKKSRFLVIISTAIRVGQLDRNACFSNRTGRNWEYRSFRGVLYNPNFYMARTTKDPSSQSKLQSLQSFHTRLKHNGFIPFLRRRSRRRHGSRLSRRIGRETPGGVRGCSGLQR